MAFIGWLYGFGWLVGGGIVSVCKGLHFSNSCKGSELK